MKAMLITPKNKSEYVFLSDLLKKLKISSSTLTEEDLEDIGLSILMRNVDRKKKVSRRTIVNKLKT